MRNAKPVSTPLAAHFKLSSTLSPNTDDKSDYMSRLEYTWQILEFSGFSDICIDLLMFFLQFGQNRDGVIGYVDSGFAGDHDKRRQTVEASNPGTPNAMNSSNFHACIWRESTHHVESSDSDPWIDSSTSDDDSDTVDLEWFAANDGPIDAKPIGAGLVNLGNTCFLNAVLQCFMHTVLLFDLLLRNTHVPCDRYADFCLICVFKELIGSSLAYDGGSLSPWKLVDNLSYFSSGFRKYQQEDAHEFLQCFLNRLESRCNDIVQQVFGGRLVSKLRCYNCGHCSNTYEPLIDVILEIKDADSLHSVLESFTRVEKLDDPEIKYTCERCKVQVSIEKQLMLYNAPSVAVFHYCAKGGQACFISEEMKYDLYAVIVHAGSTSSSGHYYSFICAEPNEWYKFDDSTISRVHEDLVLAEEAYIMFYTKRDTLCESNASAIDTSSSAPRPTGAINSSDFHELTKIADNELKKTVQMSTLGSPSAINSSKENNTSQDIGVTESVRKMHKSYSS
ncbi:ubiquitin carboxyl-terminal hydrolase 20-like [Capsicum annuum]|uniref:ubiquitin carboxyl-terminal hydrolase 20-like n=1 Tax=Capsicum annuum TaxID=4072 RepID=UPI001FB18289|nr:ubiquitin carboxyl-terminal hydrolase 20-like [Capsicum annuum]